MWSDVLPLVFGGAAALMVLLAAAWWVRASRQRRWPVAEGRIERIERVGDSDGTTEVYVASFRTPEGYDGWHTWGRGDERVGQTVRLRYDPRRPERNVALGQERQLVWAALGAAVVLAGAAVFCWWLLGQTAGAGNS